MLPKYLFTIFFLCVTARITVALEDVVHSDCVQETGCTDPPLEYPEEEEALEQRILHYDSARQTGELVGNTENCIGLKRTIHILPAKNDKMWHKVVREKYFGQKVTEITCRSEGDPCLESLSLGATTMCATVKGEVIVNVMKSGSEDGNESIIERRQIGVGCVCKIIR